MYSKNDFQAQKADIKVRLSCTFKDVDIPLDDSFTIKCNINNCTITMKTLCANKNTSKGFTKKERILKIFEVRRMKQMTEENP